MVSGAVGDRVALLAEGVDRNMHSSWLIPLPRLVALLAEGVDRNFEQLQPLARWIMSPSSRRAWIEIVFDPG